jgi:hypothetical protein
MLLAICGLLSPTVSALEITQVRLDRNPFRPDMGEIVQVRFVLSEPAKAQLNIYDGRDWLVRALPVVANAAGEQSVSWDGKAETEELVPPEAYRFTIAATGADGDTIVHDLTQATAGQEISATDINWDPNTGMIHYRLPEPARVNVRVGLQNFGPLLKTVIDWVPRAGGAQRESWDGMDESDAIDLSNHPKLDILVSAFALGANSILVGPAPQQVKLVAGLSKDQERTQQPFDPRKKRMHFHSQQGITDRGDVAIKLALGGDYPVDENGLPILSGRVPVRLEATETDLQRILERRFETVFFVDGIFTFENEVGFLPATWIWDTTRSHDGLHYVNANLRGYEGNFGMATLQVRVANSTNEHSQ